MFEHRLHQLGLDQCFQYDGDEFQRQMAKKLRQLVFLYLQGTLTDIDGNRIPAGPAVTRLRENLNIIGGMDHFVRTQSPNGAWATDIELSLLAELLDVNFVVKFACTGATTVLRASEKPNQPTFSVINTNNTAWDAYVDGKKRRTLHDNNCGYNSIAENIRLIAKPQLVNRLADEELSALQLRKQEEDKRFVNDVEDYNRSKEAHIAALERIKKEDKEKGTNRYNETIKQIDSDYQLALQIALADLPGIQGKPTKEQVNHYPFFRNCKQDTAFEIKHTPPQFGLV